MLSFLRKQEFNKDYRFINVSACLQYCIREKYWLPIDCLAGPKSVGGLTIKVGECEIAKVYFFWQRYIKKSSCNSFMFIGSSGIYLTRLQCGLECLFREDLIGIPIITQDSFFYLPITVIQVSELGTYDRVVTHWIQLRISSSKSKAIIRENLVPHKLTLPSFL